MRGGGRQGVQGVQRASLDPRVDRRSDQRRHLAASPGSDAGLPPCKRERGAELRVSLEDFLAFSGFLGFLLGFCQETKTS